MSSEKKSKKKQKVQAETPARPAAKSPGYETSDAHVKPLVYFGIGLTLLGCVSTCVCLELEERWSAEVDSRSTANPMSEYRATPTAPLLQATTRVELEAYERTEEEVLTGYGWIDQESGVVRIPIEQAMELVLERGLPDATEPEIDE